MSCKCKQLGANEMHGKEERKIIYTVVLGSSKFGSELRIQLGEIT